MNQVRTVIFAKAPLPGVSKTRLIPALGLEGSAALAQRLLEHTVAQAVEADIGPVELCVAPSIDHSIWRDVAIADNVSWSEQGQGELGERLSRAAQRQIEHGEPLLLIGTDCPQLDAAHLIDAAAALEQYDTCLIPVSDGGYALLGLRRYTPSLFTGIPWSTDKVLQLTLQRISALGWSIKTLVQLHDIDEPGDLQWLPADWQERA
jgi:rSAM/selenodomain-associated transferase 1